MTKRQWRQVEQEEMVRFAAGRSYKSSDLGLEIDKRNGKKFAGAKWFGYGPFSREEGHAVEFTDGAAIAVTTVGDYQISEITWASGWTSFWISEGGEK